jgi:hypothetical protein
MAALAPGAVKSTTIENAMLEVSQLLQNAEQAFVPPTGTTAPNRVNVTYNTDTKTVQITANLQLETAFTSTGEVTFQAAEYC